MIVFTLTIDHKHGTDTRVFRSEQGALDALAAWAREWWPVEGECRSGTGPTQAAFDALSDGEAISVYFDRMDGRESYSLDSAELED